MQIDAKYVQFLDESLWKADSSRRKARGKRIHLAAPRNDVSFQVREYIIGEEKIKTPTLAESSKSAMGGSNVLAFEAIY